MPNYYVTYGNGYVQRHNYSVVQAADYLAAFAAVKAGTNGQYAFLYTEDEFEGQAQRWGLTPIPLQPQTREWEHNEQRQEIRPQQSERNTLQDGEETRD